MLTDPNFPDEAPFPPLDEALIQRLETLFPDRCPYPTDHDRDIWIKVGRAQVVQFLRSKFNEQNPLNHP